MVDERTNAARESMDQVATYAAEQGMKVFASRISNSTKFTRGAQLKLPIFRSEPASRYAREVKALVEEFAAALPCGGWHEPAA